MSDESDAAAGAAAGAAAPGPVKWLRTKASAHWSPELARRIVERVGAGEMLYRVLRDEGMPTPQTVARWARERAEFGEALEAARRASGRSAAGGGVDTYSQGVAEEVIQRLCEGESVTGIGRDPTMPAHSTIFLWRRRRPEFERAYQTAKEVCAERLCDRGAELADAATPQTAYLTHVRLAHLRWWAGVLAPRTYRPRPQAPETPARQYDVLMRKFVVEVDKETGEKKVVAYCPNPQTGEVEREDDWRPGRDVAVRPPDSSHFD